ncbi:efflux RND transporter periplasmic adaptor subunit [Pendulispora albinea]|uniref:Efflux RND transporter periplasmic adaptor subunit n=1 Tax=Pendulispora albinea TaxID=2741071 RepID=A0ABZ2M9W9_9BACT
MSDSLSTELASLRIDRGAPASSASPSSASRGSSSSTTTSHEGRRRRTIAKVLAGTMAVVALGAAAVVSARPLLASWQRPKVRVTEIATVVGGAQAESSLTATGYVVPQRLAKVGSKVQGRIVRTLAHEGDAVHRGDVLFELDPTDLRNELVSAGARIEVARAKAHVARATVAETQRTLARERKLAATGAVGTATAEDLEMREGLLTSQVAAAEAEVKAAAAEAARIRDSLHDMRVLAPIDGVLTTKPLEVGDVVTNETTLVEIVDPASLMVEADVPEARAGTVKPGTPCELVLDAFPTERRRGQVVLVGPRLNRAKATALVKVKFVDEVPELRAEMAVRVGFLREELDPAKLREPPKTVVPQSAVATRDGQKVVFVLRQETVRLERVALGESLGVGSVLAEGPPVGTRIVDDPSPELMDGQKVKEGDK